ncbi:hypothetical protein RKE38_06715 [Phycicoccus sp. M110.8]|uniref:hypothetical protein n=1 Tax=Phycicoccus sp. M110.8 TaxID=3075433 RepID=UPI0028FCFBBA|nr:hypothetical protein [Phycicoccus sp. M110.8]MDU0313375.1 hypothetical protein [Phycicoccus sp. M110.8]
MSARGPSRGTRRRRLLGAGAALGVVAALALTAYATTPRTHGVAGDWQAKPLDGRVVGTVLLSGDHTALDLRTGKSVSLGSAAGGRPYAGDGRLVVAGAHRVDSVGLDGTGRWTWRPPAGQAPVPLAARRGTTLVATCPDEASAPCDLVGIDARGHEAWQTNGTTGSGRVAAPADQGLPHAYASANQGGGVVLLDPVDGRESLVPGQRFSAEPDGPVVVTAVQGGQCVLTAYDGADPVSTRVLARCPDDVPASVEVGGAAHLTVARERRSTPANPLRWGSPTTVLTVVDTRSGRQVGRVAATGRLDLLLLDGDGLVVRTDEGITRYTLPQH